MSYKLFAVCVLLVGSAGSIVLYEVTRPPVWSIPSAEARQRELNSLFGPGDCGQWMVTRYPSGEGRVYYDVGKCPFPPEAKRDIWRRNTLIDRSRSLAEIEANIDIMQSEVGRLRAAMEAEERTKGFDEALKRGYRGIVR